MKKGSGDEGECRSHWNGCMTVAWAMFWGGSRSTKPCVFPCQVAAAGGIRSYAVDLDEGW